VRLSLRRALDLLWGPPCDALEGIGKRRRWTPARRGGEPEAGVRTPHRPTSAETIVGEDRPRREEPHARRDGPVAERADRDSFRCL